MNIDNYGYYNSFMKRWLDIKDNIIGNVNTNVNEIQNADDYYTLLTSEIHVDGQVYRN